MSSVKTAEVALPSLNQTLSQSELLRAIAQHGMYPGEKSVRAASADSNQQVADHLSDYLSGLPNVD